MKYIIEDVTKRQSIVVQKVETDIKKSYDFSIRRQIPTESTRSSKPIEKTEEQEWIRISRKELLTFLKAIKTIM